MSSITLRIWFKLSALLFLPRCLVGIKFPAVQHCSNETGGGICPLQNTCCRVKQGDSSSGCIPSDLGASVATCCSDGFTGCGKDYECASVSNSTSCVASSAIPDPLVQALPRYHLCQAGKYSDFEQIYSWQVPISATQSTSIYYYSSHGNLQDILNDDIKRILIVVHGANRNADDYFCTATAAARLQRNWPIEQVLILAPRFVVPSDLPVELLDQSLAWEDLPDGPWRYGANAIHTNTSSFDVMDGLVEFLTTQFPNGLTTIVGHSSGGQFVQRWALLSPFAGRVQAVVANPSSYAYLTPERYDPVHKEWTQPNRTGCPHYNQWEWGLEINTKDTPDYVQRVLNQFANSSSPNPFQHLVDRFAKQSVVYLAGSMDRCNVSSGKGWCSSHGLETKCEDELQGTNRWERNERYTVMLRRVGVEHHPKVVLHGVGHDHSLMFSSPEGLQVLFPVEQAVSSGW